MTQAALKEEQPPKTRIQGTVAIVGRPNVGKSTLFNRLTRSRTSIVDDRPGVTRDRIYGQAFFEAPSFEDGEALQRGFSIIDTGGFETDDFNFQPFSENLVWQQTQIAIDKADLILLVFDGKTGLHPHDQLLLRYCEEKNKSYLCLVNKVDGLEKLPQTFEFYALGLKEDCLAVSAAHSKGIQDLLFAVDDKLKLAQKRKPASVSLADATKIALIGRPNAGKSSILNALLGEDRSLVSPLAGTTRDSIDTPYLYHKKPYVLIDTAGIRRKTKISDPMETQSVIRSLQAIDRADVVVLVIDAMIGVTDQDARLLNLAIDRGKPILLVLNKWDLIPEKDANTAKIYEKNIHDRYLKEFSFLPILTVSCTGKQRVHRIMEKIQEIERENGRKIQTAQVNECLRRAVDRHTPQIMRNTSKRVKFYYATQVDTCPPLFIIMCNVSDQIQESYKRYLTRQLQKDLGFSQVPIKLLFRGKKEVMERKQSEKEEPQ
jgi:GTP-binding protein